MKSRNKNFLVFISLVFVFISVLPTALATDFSSSSFTVKDPVVDSGQSSSSSTNYGLGQSLSQTAIGKSTSDNYQLWSGFQYYFKVNANTLTATAGAGQVSLSWTVPSTFLGVSVGDYDVGVGVVSGSYTFENVGNVNIFTKTGLTNGTTYYFRIKAKTAGGAFLVYSNEATATPTGTGAPPPVVGSGGGGISLPQGTLILNGLASPQATVTILKSGVAAASVTASLDGAFTASMSLNPGTYSFGIYAVDRSGTRSATLSLSETVVSRVSKTIDNLFIAPTLQASHTIVKKGETIKIFGYTVPAAVVTITIDGAKQLSSQTTSGSDGLWQWDLSTGDLEFGIYDVIAQAQKNSLRSPPSLSVSFQVGEKSVVTPPVSPCGRSDLNCDGRVNLVDFSILLYYWEQMVGSNVRADINRSGFVDIIDFSIMLYDWTG